MTEVSVVGPADGEVLRLGPTQMRILEDGRTTGHRLGLGEITLTPKGRRSTGTPGTTRASTSSRARRASPSGTRPTRPRPEPW
jgi:hypothetical protein